MAGGRQKRRSRSQVETLVDRRDSGTFKDYEAWADERFLIVRNRGDAGERVKASGERVLIFQNGRAYLTGGLTSKYGRDR